MAEFLWLDLETTGLDPDREIILEWAVLIADDGKDGTFEVEQEFSSVVMPYAFAGRDCLAEMDPYVRRMHEKNGLLADIAAGKGAPLAEADAFLAELAGDTKPSIAGNSVGSFDLQFIRRHMPLFAAKLSHRVYDVSTLIRAERTYGDAAGLIEVKADAHRAAADARASLATAKSFRARRF